jgi:hypothetical protein
MEIGGYFVCEVTDNKKVKVWFIKANDESAKDTFAILEGTDGSTINTDDLGPPAVIFCECANKQFQFLQMIVNTTLCGDFAGGVLYGLSSGDTCTNDADPDYACKVACNTYSSTATLDDAYWDIAYINTFKKSN